MNSTTNESAYSLFFINQAAHATNLSRSSLIRLEEKGLLTPVYTDPDTGYRQYNNDNIARILQIQKFQRMGFSTEEIRSYYASNGKAEGLLATLEQRLFTLQQQIAEMRLRSLDVPDMYVSVIELPETICCIRKFRGCLIQDRYHSLYDFFHECVERGLVLTSEPLFFINERTDYLEGRIASDPFDSYVCIPVLPEQAPEDAVPIPACTALSLVYYGDYSNMRDAYLHLGEQVRERGLTPAGFIRVIALVAPYVGQEIDQTRYCTQLVLPIKSNI